MSEPAKFTPADHAAVEVSLQERPAQLAPFWTNARALLESADEFTANAGVRRPPSNGSSRAERLARRAAIAQEAFAELSSALGSVRERVTGSLPGETVIRASVQSVTPQGTVRKGDGSTVDLTAVPSTPEGFQSKGRELLNKWEKHPKVNFEAANPMGSDSSGSDMEETTFNAKCALQLRFRVAEGASDEAIQLLLDKCATAEKVASKKFEESDLVDRPFLVNTRREANPDGYGPPSLVLTLLTSEPDPFTQSMAQNVLAENLTHKPLQPFRSLHVNAKLPLSGREWLAGNIPALFSLDGAEGDVELVGNRLDFEVLLNAVAHMANGAADTDNFEGAGDLAVLLKNSLGGSLARSADVSVVLQPFALSIAQAARTDVTSRRRRFMSCGALPLASNMNDEACSRFHASNAVENLALREFIEKSFLWVTGQNMASLVTYEMTKCFLDALEKEGSGSESDDSDQIVSNALSLAASRVATAAHVIESLTSLTIQSSVYDVAVKFTGFNPFSDLPKSDRDCIERSRRDVLRYRALVKKEAAEFKKTLRQAKKDEEEDDAEKEKSESSEEEEDDQLYTFSNNVADPNMRLSQIRSLEEDFSDYVEEDYTKYPTFDFETFQPRTSVRVLFVCGEAHESFDARRAVFKSGVGFDLPQRSVRRFTGAEELREQVEESTSLRDDPVLPVVLPYVHGGRRFTLYFLGEKEKVPLCSMHAVVKLVDTFEATEDAEDDDEGSVVPVFVTVGSAGAGKVVRSTSKIALNSASSIGEVLDRIVDQLPSAVRAASADKPLALEF